MKRRKNLRKMLTDEEIENFKSTKRVKIDNHFKKIINTIDINQFVLTSELETSLENVNSREYRRGILKKYGLLLKDEIKSICNYNLEQFELKADEIMNKYKKETMNADSDEINSLVFKKFCFLHYVDKIHNEVAVDFDEFVKIVKFKLVICDWYLNENQLRNLK